MGIWPRGFPSLLLAEDPERNAPIRSPLLFGHFPKFLRYSVSIAEKVSNPLWTFPKELPISLRFCLNGLQELLGSFPKESRHRFRHFLYISLEAACFSLLRLKIGDTTGKFQNHQRFFSQLLSTQPYHLWPNSNFFDSPFKDYVSSYGREQRALF